MIILEMLVLITSIRKNASSSIDFTRERLVIISIPEGMPRAKKFGTSDADYFKAHARLVVSGDREPSA